MEELQLAFISFYFITELYSHFLKSSLTVVRSEATFHSILFTTVCADCHLFPYLELEQTSCGVCVSPQQTQQVSRSRTFYPAFVLTTHILKVFAFFPFL